MTPTPINIARMKARLSELGWSYCKLAEVADISESTVKRVIAGSIPNASTVNLIATALGVSPEYLKRTEAHENDTDIKPKVSNEPVLYTPDTLRTETLKHIVAQHKERIDELKESHKARVDSLTRDKIALAIVAGFLIAFILTIFLCDILAPGVGWFR